MTPCPICHGEKQVWYDLAGHRLQTPIPCRCCRRTGLALYAIRVSPATQAATEAGHKGGAASVEKRRQERTLHPRTLMAISSATYHEYRGKCEAAGIRPSGSGAWRRLRVNYRHAEEFVEGKKTGGRRCSRPSP